MKTVLDLHTHSYFSDGTGTPEKLVAVAREKHPALAHLALSDHNTFAGCRYFISACEKSGIEGFVASEVSGSHPKYRGREFHFLIIFGNSWNPGIEARTREFSSYFNRLAEVDISNLFRFLDALASLGEKIDLREVLEETYRRTYFLAGVGEAPSAMAQLTFKDLRAACEKYRLPQKYGFEKISAFEKFVWEKAGTRPEATPVINEAFEIIRKTKPAVIEAHPYNHGLTLEEMLPLWEEWKREMGLLAVELHYKGNLPEDWRAAAEEHGLLISGGTDAHTLWEVNGNIVKPPVGEGKLADNYEMLLEKLRAAGEPGV